MPDNLIVRQTPQRQRLAGGAGDAVGILRGASGKTNAVDFSAVRSRRLEVFEAASNAFLGEERSLEERGTQRGTPCLQNGLCTHRRQDGRTFGDRPPP
jgi:hypothetical protein